jgi:iron-sulfur cluster assembly accessory protein
VITVSDKAKTYLTEQLDQSHHHFVRLSVRGGGCAGFSYDYEFCDATEPLDFRVDIDEDKAFLVDGTSLMYVIGTELDYISDLSGSALKLINPNEKSSCGCGKSFSI